MNTATPKIELQQSTPHRKAVSGGSLKEVDPAERTVRFWQEVFDDQGRLVEVHEKYPVDKGHQKV